MDEKKVKVSQIEEHVNKSIKNKSVKDGFGQATMKEKGPRKPKLDWPRGKGSNRSRMSDQDKLYRLPVHEKYQEMLGQIRSMLNEGRLRNGKYNAR
jgi:hypothetical protein